QAIGADDYKLAWRMVEAIREKPSLVALLDPTKGKPEVTFRCQMKHFQLQCRVDWWVESTYLDVNVKTIDRLAEFDRHFINYGYYKGAAFYRAVIAKVLGVEPSQPQSAFLVVEKQEPWQAVIREPDAQALQIGWQEVERLLMKLKGCFEANDWPGEPDVARPVSLPVWKLKEAL
ncbi:MAG: PD-(D/E)XK nuclease-like domain-containing protein, partial [Patescibacteria group bacterium]|nr:PD-(D/E)XK nuclease-like domain-containing protein [Patescibacteria group bacterium]